MKSQISKLFIQTTDRIISVLLDNPYLFNHVRYLLAGRQKRMKHFIKKHLDEYKCKSIADICSGTGDFAELVDKNATYIGLDLNEDFINYARNRYKGDAKK